MGTVCIDSRTGVAVVRDDRENTEDLASAQGKPTQAIQLYQKMLRSSLEPNGHVFVAALHACARAGDVESGRQVHADVLESGIQQHNTFVCNSLVYMYAKCGELEDARKVFDSTVTRNAVTWNAMIAGYAKCGELEGARKVFHSLSTKDAVTWTAMINGNLVEVSNVAALAAFLSSPECSLGGEDGQEVIVHSPEVVDPSLKEGAIMGGRLTVTVNTHGEVCAVQKGAGVEVSTSEVMRCLRIAADVTDVLKKAVG